MASWHLLQWVVGALWPPLYPGTAVPLAKGRSERRPQVPAPYPGSSLWLRKRITTWAREQPEPRERAPPGLGSSPAPLAIPAAAAAAATAAAAAKPSRRPHIPRRPRPPRRTAARTAYNTRPRHATRLPALGSLCGLPPEVRLSPGTELGKPKIPGSQFPPGRRDSVYGLTLEGDSEDQVTSRTEGCAE